VSGQPACSLCIKSLSESPLPRARARPACAAARTARVPPNLVNFERDYRLSARQPLCARPRQAQLCGGQAGAHRTAAAQSAGVRPAASRARGSAPRTKSSTPAYACSAPRTT